MVPEASLEQTGAGLVPKGDGWFVINAKAARWFEHEKFGSGTVFEGEPEFEELGINIGVLEPGSPGVFTTVRALRKTSSSSGASACCSSKARSAR